MALIKGVNGIGQSGRQWAKWRKSTPGGCPKLGSTNLTCRLDFRDSYYVRSGLLDHLSSDDLDYRSDGLFYFPRCFLRWRGFGLGGSLRRFRSL